MGVAGDLALTALVLASLLLAPLEAAFGVLVVCWLVVPGTLIVPHGPHLLAVDRLALWTMAARLLLRAGRPGEPPASAYRPSMVHVALFALLVVAFVDGVAVVPPSSGLAGDLHAWLYVLDVVVLFTVALAVLRTVGLWRAVRLVAAGAAVSVVIGIVERLSGHGWSHFFFEGLPIDYLAPGSSALTTRGGHVRAQAGAQFALEYGWVLAVLVPLLLAAAIWRTRRSSAGRAGLAVLPVVALVAVVLSGSRSAEVAGAVGVVVFALATARLRHLPGAVGLLLVVGALVVLADPGFVTSAFSSAATVDPSSVRVDRLPVLFSSVAGRPWTGGGYLASSAFYGLDNAYALMYADLGVVGVVAWAVVFAAALATAARGFRLRRGSEERTVALAAGLGILGIVVACAVYDVVDTVQSPWALAVLAALAVAATDAVPRRRWRGFPPWRSLLPLAGLVAGMAVWVSVPASASETLTLTTVAPWVEADNSAPVDGYTGTALARTLCGEIAAAGLVPGSAVHCTQMQVLFAGAYPTVVGLEVRGSSPAVVRAELHRAMRLPSRTMPLSGGPVGVMAQGKPAWAVTAPFWLAVLGAAAALVLPIPVRGRRRDDARSRRSEVHGAGDRPPSGGGDRPPSGAGLRPALHASAAPAPERG